jgi:hypothetical protein
MSGCEGPLDTPPEEPGWWLASDGKWYPPERPPSWEPQATPPRTSQLSYRGTRPSALTLALVTLAGLVSGWLVIAWDLSEVDAQGHKIAAQEVAAWRVPIAFLLLVGVVVIATRRNRRSWIWIGGAAAVGVDAWYTWRGYASRTNGANMTGVGTVFLLPFVLPLTIAPAWLAQYLAQRSDRRREHAP